jgi:hypothetical protein
MIVSILSRSDADGRTENSMTVSIFCTTGSAKGVVAPDGLAGSSCVSPTMGAADSCPRTTNAPKRYVATKNRTCLQSPALTTPPGQNGKITGNIVARLSFLDDIIEWPRTAIFPHRFSPRALIDILE